MHGFMRLNEAMSRTNAELIHFERNATIRELYSYGVRRDTLGRLFDLNNYSLGRILMHTRCPLLKLIYSNFSVPEGYRRVGLKALAKCTGK